MISLSFVGKAARRGRAAGMGRLHRPNVTPMVLREICPAIG